MPEQRHQLNLKPEQYTIYIKIKEEKEKQYAAFDETVEDHVPITGRIAPTYGWSPCDKIAHQCEDMELNAELLINKPGYLDQDLGVRISSAATDRQFILIRQKDRKNN